MECVRRIALLGLVCAAAAGAEPAAVMQDVLKNCKKVEDDCEIFL